MIEFPFAAPRPLTAEHHTAEFDCGQPPLNEFLQRYALANQRGGSARTFVIATPALDVVGYYSLSAAALAYEDATERLKKGQAQHPIPAILMARFAVALSEQGQGLGRALFRDALLRALHVTDDLGARVFVVDAKDEAAIRFYQHFGMTPSPNNPHRLYLLFKDIKKLLAA